MRKLKKVKEDNKTEHEITLDGKLFFVAKAVWRITK